MRTWLDLPLAQWIYARPDGGTWAVVVGDYVRARFTEQGEAEALVERLREAMEELESQG